MKFHHRRHLAQCLSLRNFLYVGHFFFLFWAIYLHFTGSIWGRLGGPSCPARCSCTSRTRATRTRADYFHFTGSVWGRLGGPSCPARCSCTSRTRAFRSFRVSFAFRFVRTLQGELLPHYRKHLGQTGRTQLSSQMLLYLHNF